MSGVRIVFLFAVWVQVVPAEAVAQQPQVGPGTRVRVTAPELDGSRLVGTVKELGDGRLMLEVEDQAASVELPLASISKLEVSLGMSSRQSRMWKGAGIGFLCGGLVTVMVFLATYDTDDNIFQGAGKLYAGAGAGAVVALPCAVLGGVIGAATAGERWKVVEPIDELGISVQPTAHGGVTVTMSRSF